MSSKRKWKLPQGKALVTKSKAIPLGPSMLKIIVGQGESARTYIFNESILTGRSRFFRNAMKKGWKEAEEKLVKLPYDDPDTFALYEQLVYTGRIPVFHDDPERIFCDDDDYNEGEDMGDCVTYCKDQTVCETEYASLFKLYIFAEKIQDSRSKKSTIDAITTKVTHECEEVHNHEFGPCLPNVSIIKMVYESTSENSPARGTLVDCYAYAECRWVTRNLHQGFLADISPKFLLDLAHSAIANRHVPLDSPFRKNG